MKVRSNRQQERYGIVRFSLSIHGRCSLFKTSEKSVNEEKPPVSLMKDPNAVEKAEQEFWRMIEEEKRRRERRIAPVC